jgi:hypothetical protein
MAVTVSPPEVTTHQKAHYKHGVLKQVANSDTITAAKHLFVPDGKLWDLQNLTYKLVASGDAASRQTTFVIYDSKRVEQYRINAAAVSVASSTEYFYGLPGMAGGPTETVATFHHLPLPGPTLLAPGWELEVLQSSGSDDGTQSAGTLTIAEPVTAGDTFTINGVVFTLVAALTALNQVLIGASEAATKVNMNAAFGATPSDFGTLHSVTDAVRQSLLVTAADFATDDMVFTAVHAGSAYDAIDTTETFTHASNVFDAATLGTTAAGVDADDNGDLRVIVAEYTV